MHSKIGFVVPGAANEFSQGGKPREFSSNVAYQV
jgi:hypothetical protein